MHPFRIISLLCALHYCAALNAQTVTTPIRNPKLSGTMDVSGVTNKPAVLSGLGAQPAFAIGTGLSLTSGVLSATGGSGGGSTTNASLLTSGILDNARLNPDLVFTNTLSGPNGFYVDTLGYLYSAEIDVTGLITAAQFNNLAITNPFTTGTTLTIAGGKTFTVSNTLTLAGTNGSTLNIGTGGSLQSAAFTASTAYSPAFTTSAALRALLSDESGMGPAVFAGGNIGAATGTSLTLTGAVTASNLTGTNTGDQTTISGNAGTATALQTARTINGVSFDGTANITAPAAAGTLTGATLASGVTASSLTTFGAGPNLGTPSVLIGTNITGTGSAFTSGNSTAIGGVTITGTPTAGQVPTATGGAAGTWQTPTFSGTVTVNALGTGYGNGITQKNTTAATAGATMQYAPYSLSTGTAFNTSASASNYVDFRGVLQTVTGSGTTIGGQYVMSSRVSAAQSGSFLDRFTVNFSPTDTVIYVGESTLAAHVYGAGTNASNGISWAPSVSRTNMDAGGVTAGYWNASGVTVASVFGMSSGAVIGSAATPFSRAYVLDINSGSNGLAVTTMNNLPLPSVVSSTTLSATATGATLLYTVQTGRTFIPTQAIVRVTSVTGTFTSGPTLSIGKTSTAYSDIYASTAITALTNTGAIFGFNTTGMSVNVGAGGNVYANITTAAAGGSAMTIAIDLIGYRF